MPHTARVTEPDLYPVRHLVVYTPGGSPSETYRIACNGYGSVARDEMVAVDELPENTCVNCESSIYARTLRGRGVL